MALDARSATKLSAGIAALCRGQVWEARRSSKGEILLRNRNLLQKLGLIKFALEDLRGKRYKGKKKHSPDNEEKNPPKKKGGKFGHLGWFRKKPEKIDKTEEVNLTQCPCCGSKDLEPYAQTEDHIQEDIILPERETTLYKKKVFYCKTCKETVTGKGTHELPRSYIGPRQRHGQYF